MNPARQAKVYAMPFAAIYPLYRQKIEKKGRTQQELDTVLTWLTGYTKKQLQKVVDDRLSLEDFFSHAPQIHSNAHKITGLICGYRVEDIADPLMQKIRWMDKIVDELAKGKALEKILRS